MSAGLLLLAVVGGSAWAYAQDGTLIYEIEPPVTTWLTWDELPKTAVNATISAIAPAYFENDENAIMEQFLDEQIGVGDSYMRPLVRHHAADVYSKEQVLEYYLNRAYYGYLMFNH